MRDNKQKIQLSSPFSTSEFRNSRMVYDFFIDNDWRIITRNFFLEFQGSLSIFIFRMVSIIEKILKIRRVSPDEQHCEKTIDFFATHQRNQSHCCGVQKCSSISVLHCCGVQKCSSISVLPFLVVPPSSLTLSPHLCFYSQLHFEVLCKLNTRPSQPDKLTPFQ